MFWNAYIPINSKNSWKLLGSSRQDIVKESFLIDKALPIQHTG